jgi:hypothetical protein
MLLKILATFFFDNLNEYQTYVIERQGKKQYDEFIHEIKKSVFENTNMTPREIEKQTKMAKYNRLKIELGKWEKIVELHYPNKDNDITNKIIGTIKHIRYEELRNAKAHYICIGKYGNIARMINPKQRCGPVAGNFYPTLPGEPIRRTINDYE